MENNAALPSSGACVPQVVFESSALPVSDRFAAWRESTLPLFESLPQERPERFKACVESVDLGHVFFGMSAFSPLRFYRGRRHPASERADHVMVQLYLAGGYVGHNGYREMCVRAGDISVLDLRHELQTSARASNVLSLIIPREQLYSYANPEHLVHGSVLRGDTAMGRILSNQLLTTWHELRTASDEDTSSIKHLVLSSVVSAFTEQPGRRYGGGERVTLEAICAYLAQNLTDHLEAEDVCRHFACSRAQLYRLTQPLGGIAAYIRAARLRRCWDELTEHSGRKKRIFEVASRWGFTSQSHFTRLFRQTFGIAPSEAAEYASTQWSTKPAASPKATPGLPELHDILRKL